MYPLFEGVYERVISDLRDDRVLRYILLVSLVFAGFWFWWRIPNFATPDEYRRIGQPMEVARYLLSDPGLGAVRRAAEAGVGRDATTYLHGFLLLPLFVAVLLVGELSTFLEISGVESTFVLWNVVPAWFWTTALLITRGANVLLTVASVYVTYRIGTQLADRRAGRIAAVFTALSLAVVSSAHEVNEDTPMLFLLLVTLYLAIRYLETSRERYFLVGCLLGGLAIAFKLTAGVAVVFLGCAFVLQAATSDEPLESLWQPRLLGTGLLLGTLAIYIGIPNLLLRGPDWFISSRIAGEVAGKTATMTVPQGYNGLLAYLNGLGLPLTLGVLFGVVATARRCVRDRLERRGEILVLAGLLVYLAVFLGLWSNVRTHHVLPSIPLLTLALGLTASAEWRPNRSFRKVTLALLLVTTGVYAGLGTYQYTNDPRDEAAEWMRSKAPPEATVTVYENSPAHVGIVHGRPVDHYDFGRSASFPGEPFTDWVLATPEREPEYIQTDGTLRHSAQYPRRARYMDRLMDGDHYGYVVAAEFGQRPREYAPTREVLRAGIYPTIEKRESYIRVFAVNETYT